MITGHGGNIYDVARKIGCAPGQIIDFSSNVNPLGPMPDLVQMLRERIDRIAALPDAAGQPAVDALAATYDLDPSHILAGNGTTQFIYMAPVALKTVKAAIVGPTYADYADACRIHQVAFEVVMTDAGCGYRPDLNAIDRAAAAADTIFICNPNNPTGALLSGGDLVDLMQANPGTRFVLDESYLPFVQNADRHSLLAGVPDNCLVLHSMSKIFRIPGLRLGYLIAPAEKIAAFKRFMQPWSLNALAQAAAVYLAQNPGQVERFIKDTRAFVRLEREKLLQCMAPCDGVEFYPSQTLFLLACLREPLQADRLQQRLLESKILIRNCANFDGLTAGHFRVSLKTEEQNRALAGSLRVLLEQRDIDGFWSEKNHKYK